MRDALGAALAAAVLAFAVVVLGVGIGDGRSAPQARAAPGGNDLGRSVFARMGCGSCHALAAAGSNGQFGPDLDSRLGQHTRASLIAQITSPAGQGYSGMPTDFGSRMDGRELEALVRFLLSASAGR